MSSSIPSTRLARLAGALLALAALGTAPAARATLGGDQASVQADRQQMSAGTATSTPASGYTVWSFTLPSGTVVREYTAASGTVFAVAWEGPLMPDLQQLLGRTHFATMEEANRNRTDRGPLALKQSNLVLQSTGHMRAFAGRAWLADQLPSGVDTDAIR